MGDAIIRLWLTCCLLGVTRPARLVGQESPPASRDTASSVTFVSQLGYNFRVNGNADRVFANDRKHYLTSDLAWLWPTGHHVSAGPGTFIGMENGGEVRAGAKFHLLASHSGVQLGLQTGLLFIDSRFEVKKPTFALGASVGWDDWVTLRTQVEFASSGRVGETASGTYAGLLIGSTAGKVGHLIAGAIVAVLGIIILAGDYD